MNFQLSQPMSGSGPAEAYEPSGDPAGLGLRTVGSDSTTGELHDVLRLTPDLGRPAIVEMTVRERAAQFAGADLAGVAEVVRVDRAVADGRVEVWSRSAEGFRISAALEWTEARGIPVPLEAALVIGDRLLAALASIQNVDNTSGASGHGAIAIDQVLVDETGRLTLTDYAFGTAIAGLQWPREQLWRRFRIAMPPAAGLLRFDHRVDVTQAAVVICALLAGRRFRAEEYPRNLEAMVVEAVHRSCGASGRDDRDRLGVWLRAAAEVEPRSAFPSAAAARRALREVLGHRLNDTESVGCWLRAALGISEPVSPGRARPGSLSHAAAVAAPGSASEPPTGDSTIGDGAGGSRPSLMARLRDWFSAR